MFIIFGFRDRIIVVARGIFYCQTCGMDRSYVRQSIQRWFTLFFIPLFPTGSSRGERIQCLSCGSLFAPAALNVPTREAMDDLIKSAFRQCAVALLKAGDPASTLGRTVAVDRLADLYRPEYTYDDAVLERDLQLVDPLQIAVYVDPIADRFSAQGAELFVSQCVEVAVADGSLTDAQLRAVTSLATSFEMTQVHLQAIIAAARPIMEATRELSQGDEEEA